jgi:hypothetical protein
MSIYSSDTKSPDLDSFVGRTGNFDTDGLSFGVRVVKARLRFGHLDLLITPTFGKGERWVEQHRVNLSEAEEVTISAEVVSGPTPIPFIETAFEDSDQARIAAIIHAVSE